MIPRTALPLVACLALAMPAAAQSGGPPPPAPSIGQPPRAADAGTMYEDIEIFRRLLNNKLASQYGPLKLVTTNWNVYCTSCHAGNLTTTAGPNRAFNALHGQYLNDYATMFSSYLSTCTRNWQGFDAHPLNTEGVYLKGQGVVFTLTLPTPKDDPRPGAAPVGPKGISEWDRVRQDVRNEKPAEPKDAPKKDPTLGELLLKVVADNGQHLKELGDNETLTIVVTFRKAEMSATQWKHGLDVGMYPSSFQDQGTVNRPAATKDPAGPGGTSPTSGGFNPGSEAPGTGSPQLPGPGSFSRPAGSSSKDYELLGDLLVKQGKHAEAIANYKRALEARQSENKMELYRKLAQAYLAESDLATAQQWLEKALAKETTTAPPGKSEQASTKALPSKLILSARKSVLTAAGTGKLSMEEFQKNVSVEYLNFPAKK